MPGSIIVVTGPPGAGKTTVGRILAGGVERGVHVEADWFWRFIRGGFVEPWLPASRAQNELVMGIVGRVAGMYAAGGYETVVDGIIGPWLLGRFLAAIEDDGAPVHYIVLRPPVDVALERARQRTSPDLTDEAPIRKMYEEFCALGEHERFVLDTRGLSPEETAARLRAAPDRFRL